MSRVNWESFSPCSQQGLLQPVAVPHGGDHGKDGDRALLGGGDQAGENEAVEPQQQRRAQ